MLHLRPHLDLVLAFDGRRLHVGGALSGSEVAEQREEGGRGGGIGTLADTSLIATGVPLCTCIASCTLPCDPLSSTLPKRYRA